MAEIINNKIKREKGSNLRMCADTLYLIMKPIFIRSAMNCLSDLTFSNSEEVFLLIIHSKIARMKGKFQLACTSHAASHEQASCEP